MPPKVKATYEAVWSYETGHGPVTMRHEFKTLFGQAVVADPGKRRKAAERSFKRFAIRHGLNRNMLLHDLVVKSVGEKPLLQAANAPSSGGVYVVRFRIRYEYNGYEGRTTVVRNSHRTDDPEPEEDASTGVFQHTVILKNRDAVAAFIKKEVQSWKEGVEAGTIRLANTFDTLTDKPPEAYDESVVRIDPTVFNAKDAGVDVRRIRMKESAPEKIFITRSQDGKAKAKGSDEVVSVVLKDVCVLKYLVNEGRKWAEGSKGKTPDGSTRCRGWKKDYPQDVTAMAEWFGLKDASEGVSIEMLLPFCKKFGYNLYAFDCMGGKLETYQVGEDEEDAQKKRSMQRNSVSLVFWIKDAHVYPVLDKDFKMSLIRQTSSHRFPRQKYKEEDIRAIDPNPDELVRLVGDESVRGLILVTDIGKESCLEDIYEQIVLATGLHPMAELSASGVAILRTERVEIRLCEEPKTAYEIARRLGVDYHGQSITAIGVKALTAIKGEFEPSLYSSEFSRIVSSREFYRSAVNITAEELCECGKVLKDCAISTLDIPGHKDSGRLRLPSMHILENGLDEQLLTTVDITNNYPTNAANMPTKFPIFTVGDEVKEYSLALFDANEAKKDSAELASSFYYCETNAESRLSPFWHGNGYYDIEVVLTARKHKCPFKITHRLRAEKYLAHDFFAPFMERLENVFDLANADEKRMYKAVATRTIGSLGSHKPHTATRSCTTRDPAMMSYLYWDIFKGYLEKKKTVNINVRTSSQYGYVISVEEPRDRDGDSRPMNAKIIQYTYCRLYEMYMKVKKWSPNAELVQIRTDAMSFLFGSAEEKKRVDALLEKEDGWKFEPVMKKLKNPTMIRVRTPYVRQEKSTPWNEISVSSSNELTPEMLLQFQEGALIEGKPGTGKSTVIRTFREHLKAEGISHDVVAYTNNVARRLDGKTIHATLEKKSYGSRDVIIIDEVYMVNIELMYSIIRYKKKHPATRFYLFGDYRQLPPVERVNYDYVNGGVLKVLVPTRITLQENYRYGKETEAMLDAVWDDPKAMEKFAFKEGYCKRALVPGHTLRKRINQLQMQEQERRNSGKAGKGRWVSRENLRKQTKRQPIYLHAGLPVMTFAALKTLGILYRNTTFKVHTWEHGKLNELIFPDSDKSQLAKRRESWGLLAKNAITLVGWDFEKDVIDPFTVLCVTFAEFVRYFCPAYAQTVHITQGATIEGDYTIVNYKKFSSVNMLYTALSRCRNIENLHVMEWRSPLIDKASLAQRLEKNVGKIYGGTWLDFIAHSKLPQGSHWYDYGLDLHIDHCKSREEFRKEGVTDESIVNHISNLQVLRMEENLSKQDSPVRYERKEVLNPVDESESSDPAEDESDSSDGSDSELDEVIL